MEPSSESETRVLTAFMMSSLDEKDALGGSAATLDGPLGFVARPVPASNVRDQGRQGGAEEVRAGESDERLVDGAKAAEVDASDPGGAGPISCGSGTLLGALASPQCIDVRALGRFKVRVTEDHLKGSRIDPWNLEMVCVKGVIYPHGGTLLQAYTARSRTRNLLKALPCVMIHQDGDLETTVVFDQRDFSEVASVMKPRRRRPAPAWLPRGPGPHRP